MHDAHLKRKALELRARGMALDDLVLRLALPRTTVYEWVKELPIERTIKQSEAQKRGSAAGKLKAALKRQLVYQEALLGAPELLQEQRLRDFVVLYLAEGSRRSRHTVEMCNSNPQIVLLSYEFIARFSARKLSFALQYHADQNPSELAIFWSNLLGVEPEKIRLTRKSNSGELTGRTWRSEYGVLSVRSSDTFFRCQLQAWMDFVSASWHTVA